MTRPTTVTLVGWYATAAGALLALFPLMISLDMAFQGGPAGLLLAAPGLVTGALCIVGGQGTLAGRAWARAVLLAGLACGILVGGMLFFMGPVLLVAVVNVVAMAALFQPEAKAWYAKSPREGTSGSAAYWRDACRWRIVSSDVSERYPSRVTIAMSTVGSPATVGWLSDWR